MVGDALRTGARPRLEDVAARAGVSVTTVSHVLNDKGRVSEETRVKVLEAATRLRYRPNPIAQRLAEGRTGIVAITASLPGDGEFPFAQITYFLDIINAATQTAIDRGWAMIVAPTGAVEELWAGLPADGAIVADPAAGDPKIDALRRRGIPVVTIAQDPNQPKGTGLAVQNDDRLGTRRVLEHFLAQGASHAAVLTFDPFDWFTIESVAAYEKWSAERGAEPVILAAPLPGERALPDVFAENAQAFFDLPADRRPDAAYCLFEGQAISLLAEAARRGIRVPEDLLVATVNDRGLAGSTNPPLTTLEANPKELGARAASLLLDAIEGTAPESLTITVPSTLVPRRSSLR